ncbi:uroporphyrinogen-III synthase [Pustulibacterium marinum]|uniref:Uroporphyrinogen-III synthase n=1 Tax=Pustulibacterium marinum TaxID=1224947 RepID=A0A1I7ESZ9_9FLAO|nr:uroporphyrinogen-III synthase [Pustulibacterium marinum]SFU27055.1 uroporphyrinogen-III synthase [Pustulibacterium marinum]
MKARILSTKKLTLSQQELLLNKGFSLVQADFIKIDFMKINADKFYPNIIITSKNGVLSLEKQQLLNRLENKTVYCVGSKTERLLADKGIEVAQHFQNAKTLADFIVSEKNTEAFTYICGNIRRKELPNILKENHIVLDEKIAYKTLFSPLKTNSDFDGVLFFSPSLVESYFFNNQLSGAAFCIGETTAKSAAQYTQNIITASQPTIENVIVKVVKYFETTS